MNRRPLVFLFGLLYFLSQPILAALPAYHQIKSLIFSEPSHVRLVTQANPAYFSTLDPYELQFSWNNARENSLYLGLPVVGFGAWNGPTGSEYRVHTAWETVSGFQGVGIQWGSGQTNRTALAFQYGALYRFSDHYSIGMSGTIETSGSPGLQGVFDFGFRPTGTDSLTFGADLALDNERSYGYSLYSSLKVYQGVWFGARYFSDKTAMIGLSFELGALDYSAHGGPSALHSAGWHSQPHGSALAPVLPHTKRYLELKLPKNLPYQRYTWFDSGGTLLDYLSLIRRARLNPSIEGISLDLSSCPSNPEFIWEIRQALSEFKASGKRIIVFTERPSWMGYYLASVADWVVLDPLGGVTLLGETWNRNYYKGLLDKLGVGVEELKFFTYKTAYEGFSRERMSTSDREQLSAYIQSNYNLVKNGVCLARSVSPNVFDDWVNTHPWFSAKEALQFGLVDALGRLDSVKSKWASWNAQFKPVSMEYLLPKRDTRWGNRPVIAVVYALGVCDMDSGIKARKLSKLLQGMVDDDDIKAIVLRVDSPGGDGMASDLVSEVMKKARGKKAIIVSQGEYAASGGYWLSMYGKHIVSAPNSLTGSIGVISQWLYNKSLSDWTGITSDRVKKGDHADLLSGLRLPLINISIPNRPLSITEKEAWKHDILAHYDEFVSRVALARNKPTADIQSVAQGRIWSGQDALKMGLVDAIGGLDTAIVLAKKSAGLSADAEVQIIQAPDKGLFDLKSLFGIGRNSIDLDDDTENDLAMIRFKARFNGVPLYLFE